MCAPAETVNPRVTFHVSMKKELKLIVGEIAANALALRQQGALLVVVVVCGSLRYQSQAG